MELKDVHEEQDLRGIVIDCVGIKGIRYPVSVYDRGERSHSSIATFNMYGELGAEKKGIHMSRFVELIHEQGRRIGVESFHRLLMCMKEHLQSRRVVLEISFPLFLERLAPVSKMPSLLDYHCRFWGEMEGEKIDFFREVGVPVATLCPCSKAISANGAHNQRATVKVSFRTREGDCSLEEMIEIVELSSSAPLYALVKREDEKYLTEIAYENPRFVEDLVREVALKCEAHPAISWYAIESESLESIHNHNAYAFIKSKK